MGNIQHSTFLHDSHLTTSGVYKNQRKPYCTLPHFEFSSFQSKPKSLLWSSSMKILPTLLVAALSLSQVASAAGLEIDYLTPGIECSRKSKKGDNIEVHYRGTLQETGKEFDSSYSRGSPLPFQLGAGRVIKGWDEGLVDMCIGEKRRLTIPPDMGYGARAVGPIPGNSVLVFETELMGIKGVKKDEL